MEQIKEFADRYLTQIQFIGPMDIVEIILISLMVYYLLVFIRNTRAWQLLKGVFVILVFLVIAEILQMDTILWIARTAFQFATIALIVVLQPELRKALEQLGQKNLIRSVIPFESSKPEEGLFSDRTIREIVKGCVEMSRAKTGALIVVRQLDSLAEYERTGIAVDGIVTSQLLINIFEKNTPLHDGAGKPRDLCDLLFAVVGQYAFEQGSRNETPCRSRYFRGNGFHDSDRVRGKWQDQRRL